MDFMNVAKQQNFPAINFDEFSKIRILDPVHFEESEKLKDECKDFTAKLNEFNGLIGGLVDLLSAKAKQIEQEKLKAIGLRNQVETEADRKKSRHIQLLSIVKEKQDELDRLVAYGHSLSKVVQEQTALIEQLTTKQ